MPRSVRPSDSALAETILSDFSNTTWSGVTGGVMKGIIDAMLPISEAMPKGSETSGRLRSIVCSMISRHSRKVSTSGPPSS
ncbi:hypothetical protein D9M72_642250 [compost metagenome]